MVQGMKVTAYDLNFQGRMVRMCSGEHQGRGGSAKCAYPDFGYKPSMGQHSAHTHQIGVIDVPAGP
jgi:hypothetical protein